MVKEGNMKRRNLLLVIACLPALSLARPFGPGPGPAGPVRNIHRKKERHELREDKRDFKDDMRDADDRDDVRDAKKDYREERRDNRH